MKRLVTLAVLVVGLSVPAVGAAQATNGGIIGGPGLTGIYADSDELGDATDSVAGYSLGLQGTYGFASILELTPEILFSRRGWETEGTVAGRDLSHEYGISYLEVPVLVRLAIPLGGVIAPKVMAGPHAALFIDGTRDANVSGPFLSGEGQTDIDSEDVNDLQFGFTAAAGLDVELPAVVFTTDVRYVRNLTGVFDPDDEDIDDNVYHESWQLMLGVMF